MTKRAKNIFWQLLHWVFAVLMSAFAYGHFLQGEWFDMGFSIVLALLVLFLWLADRFFEKTKAEIDRRYDEVEAMYARVNEVLDSDD